MYFQRHNLSRFAAILIASVLLCVTGIHGADKNDVAGTKRVTKTTAKSSAKTRSGKKPDESFDAFLLVAERPLHLKFHVGIDNRFRHGTLNPQ